MFKPSWILKSVDKLKFLETSSVVSLTKPRGNLSKTLKDLGGIEEVGPCFRAHVQYSEASQKSDICGPHRNDRPQAQKDLDNMRAGGALFGEDRANGLVAMKAEARRIQEHVTHEREIHQAALLRGPSGFDSDSDDTDDPAINGPDEWWQDYIYIYIYMIFRERERERERDRE